MHFEVRPTHCISAVKGSPFEGDRMTVARNVPNYPGPEGIPGAPWIGLLTTKLSAPRLRQNLVERPRLLSAISRADSGLTVICAPAGYGKSTLVTQWLIQ